MAKKLLLAAVVLLLLGGLGLLLVARSLLGSESVRARVERQLSVLTGQPVRVGSAGASIFPRVTLELSDVAIGEPAAVTARRISVATGLRGLFGRRIEDAEVLLSDAAIPLPLPFPLLAASERPNGEPHAESSRPAPPPASDTTGTPARPEDDGFTIVSIRVISVRNLEVSVARRSVRVDMESALEGDRLDVSSLSARSEHTHLTAQGTLQSLERLQGSFTLAASPLDLDELLALVAGIAGSNERPRRSAPDSEMRLRVRLTAPSGRLAGHELTDLSTTADVRPARVALAPLSFGMFGGTYAGTMTVVPKGETPEIDAQGSVEDMDLAALAAAAGNEGAITGRLDARLALSARGSDRTAILGSLRGRATGAAVDGEIPGLDLVRAVVLAFGKPSGAPPPGSGSAFSRLGGTFVLEPGTLASDDLALASRDFDLLGRMTMRVPGGQLDARADVTLSEELTKQAGTDLRRYAQEDGRVVVPARITGTLSEPVVTVDVAAALNRALQNELKRRAQSLFEKLIKKQ
ncbi:MAG TPA: AsmA-like C-terminal region-containing protein [Vicinamibacterales bacterium]|nr:AsmA-like C-terminal region-containing protein [Vicinamibacterales bacterium]